MVEIRPIRADDIPGFRDAVDCVAREKRFLARTEGPSLEQAAEFVGDNLAKNNPHLVALDGAALIGWCDIIRNDHLPIYAHSGTVGMGLLPAYRGLGVGRRLLEAAIDAARLAGMTRIALTVRADNAAAARLYQRIGFEPEGFHRHTDCIDGIYYDTRSMALIL
ncbi:MAG TPA: GNAT family N-acetyltransferase [Kaistia sp.]|nr:GNAT family N-acetyltransferase [Kaistia sp.]